MKAPLWRAGPGPERQGQAKLFSGRNFWDFRRASGRVAYQDQQQVRVNEADATRSKFVFFKRGLGLRARGLGMFGVRVRVLVFWVWVCCGVDFRFYGFECRLWV